MVWASGEYYGEPTPVTAGETVIFQDANFGNTIDTTGIAIEGSDYARYDLDRNRIESIATGGVFAGSITTAAHLGKRVKIEGNPSNALRVSFNYMYGARAQVMGLGLTRATTVLFIIRDGTDIPKISSPEVLTFTYPCDINQSLPGATVQEERSTISDSLIIESSDMQNGDVLRIGIAAFAGVGTDTLAQGIGDVEGGGSYEGFMEYENIALSWV